MLCGAITDNSIDLCAECEQDLPFIHHGCRYCAKPLLQNAFICGECLKKQPPFDHIFALCAYQKPITAMILRLKFHQQLVNAKILGELMAERLKSCPKPECLIPVPLHINRLKERGFNQALEIARPISKRLEIPIDFHSIKRIRHTEAQAQTPANKRKQNIKGAFSITREFKPKKHVAIIDDVVTTGSTVSELAKVLHRHGIEKIDIWCCARTEQGLIKNKLCN